MKASDPNRKYFGLKFKSAGNYVDRMGDHVLFILFLRLMLSQVVGLFLFTNKKLLLADWSLYRGPYLSF